MDRKGLFAGTIVISIVLTSGAQAILPVTYQTCGVCGSAFEEKAQEEGTNLTVVHSAANVSVQQDGDSTWIVRNHITNESDIERLRSEPGILYEIIGAEVDTLSAKTRPTNVSANITENGIVTITFEHSEFARQMPGNILLTDYFHTYGEHYLGDTTDRFTVTAPSGSVVTQPASNTTDGGTRVTWGENQTPANFIAYVPDESLSSVAWTKLGLAIVAIETVTERLQLILFPLVLLGFLGIGFEGFSRLISYVGSKLPVSIQASHVGIGVLLAVLSIVTGIFYFGTWDSTSDIRSLEFSLASIYIVSGIVVVWMGYGYTPVSFRRLLIPAAIVPGLGLLFVFLSDPGEFGLIGQILIALVPLAHTASVALLLPLGFASGLHEHRRLAFIWGGIIVTSGLHLILRMVSLRVIKEELQVGMYQGIGYLLYPLVLVVLGTPLYLFGLAIASACQDSG